MRKRKGIVIFITGLSGSGKSTLALALAARIQQEKSQPVTLLDGDEVRTHLSSDLSFSKEDRNLNIRRVGFVAAEIARHGGICICALIAPYKSSRDKSRHLVENAGGIFVEVYLTAPLEVCEARDPKGLYARARRGEIAQFTGVSDPYEIPVSPELRVSSDVLSPEESLEQIWQWCLQSMVC